MRNKNIVIIILVLIVIILGTLLVLKTFNPDAICWPACEQKATTTPATTTLPNPASVHCEEVGGTLDIRDEAGGQVGYCIFPDKSECEEWALLRNECRDTATSSGPIIRNDGSNFRNLSIKPGETITSPLKITGEVSDGWFFEGSFPVTLVNWDGLIIAEGLATAKGDWMTSDFVSFETELKFTKPANPSNQDYAKRGAIIFKKDNPSDMRQYDAAYELPVRF